MSQRPASAAPSQPSQFDRVSNYTGSRRPQSNFGNRAGQVTQKVGAPSPYTDNLNPAGTLHDRDQYWQTKMEKSAPFFHNARVQTCSHILRQNGKSVAVQFPLEKTGWKAPTSYQNTKRSSETGSWSAATYKVHVHQHTGMSKKPLMPYNPSATRSQLPKPTIVMPYKNSSQIVIGDRHTHDRRQFKTTNTLHQQAADPHEATTNGGILAERVKWQHKHQVMQ